MQDPLHHFYRILRRLPHLTTVHLSILTLDRLFSNDVPERFRQWVLANSFPNIKELSLHFSNTRDIPFNGAAFRYQLMANFPQLERLSIQCTDNIPEDIKQAVEAITLPWI